jgi:hypothetical protein
MQPHGRKLKTWTRLEQGMGAADVVTGCHAVAKMAHAIILDIPLSKEHLPTLNGAFVTPIMQSMTSLPLPDPIL